MKIYTRHFSLPYLGHKIAGYNKMLSFGLKRIGGIKYLKDINLPINLGDEIECYAVKK